MFVFANWRSSRLMGHEPRLNAVGLLCVALCGPGTLSSLLSASLISTQEKKHVVRYHNYEYSGVIIAACSTSSDYKHTRGGS